MPYENPLQLNLSRETRRKCEDYILRSVRDAVAGSSVRDEDLKRWRDGLHGIPASYGSAAWENACRIEDGLIQEQRAQMVAQVMAAANRFPLVTVDGADDDSRENASHVETYISNTMKRRGFPKAFYGYADEAVCYPAGVLYVGWKEEVRKRRDVRYWDGESFDSDGNEVLVMAGERDETREYAPVPVLASDPAGGGHEFRSVPLLDFYLYPPDTPSIEQAAAVMERRYYSDNDLLNGIEEFGFDEDSVMEAIRQGARGGRSDTDNEGRERLGDTYGVEAAPGEDARPFECFLWYGYLPKLWDGNGRAELPRYLWNDLFCAVVCPACDTVLKLDFAPDTDEYPYALGSIQPETGSPYGMGICLLLEAEQQEATHYRRLAANCADLVASPVTIMADDAWELNRAHSIYPGAILREETPGSIRPYEMPNAPVVVATQMLDYTLQRGQRKTAAQGYGQVNPKQPLVAEMEGVMAATDTKFDFFQSNVFSVLPWVARRMVKLELQYNPNFAIALQGEGESVTLTAEQLSGQYEYNVAQLDQNASEQAKVQRDMAIAQLQQGFFQFLLETIGTPLAVFAEHKWRQTRDALSHLSVRKPEDYIGPKPPPQGIQPPPPPPLNPMDVMAQILPQMAGGGAGGMKSGANGNGQTPQAAMGVAGNGFNLD